MNPMLVSMGLSAGKNVLSSDQGRQAAMGLTQKFLKSKGAFGLGFSPMKFAKGLIKDPKSMKNISTVLATGLGGQPMGKQMPYPYPPPPYPQYSPYPPPSYPQYSPHPSYNPPPPLPINL